LEAIMLIDPLRVYVLWAPRRAGANDPGRRLARALRSQLDLVGMIRDGIGFRIPVRQRSLAWRPMSSPRPIDLAAARWNVVIVVEDDVMRLRQEWAPYVAKIAADIDERGAADLLLPVMTSMGENLPVIDERRLQGILAPTPDSGTDDAWDDWLRRVTMYAMGVIWAHQRTARLRQNKAASTADTGDDVRKIRVFLSHAKKDGEGAALLVERFRRLAPTKDKVGVNSIDMYFDNYDTVAGNPYTDQFKNAIRDGALLAVLTDAYHGRPWCMWELLSAKEHKSPILIWDLSHRGTQRSFPYLGNVPVLRTPGARYGARNAAEPEELVVDSIGDQEIERVLMALLSEATRMEVWSAHAEALVKAGGMTQRTTMVCARPPELTDLVHEHAAGATTIVYPDPPIGVHEQHLLAAAFPQMTLLPLSEVSP
jgi:hypothetical protein